MKRTVFTLSSLCLLATLTGCSISLLGIPTPVVTQISIPSPTPFLATPTTVGPTPTLPTPTMNLPTVTPANPGAATATTGSSPLPTTSNAPTPTTGGIIPAAPSGPYGVILVAPGDVLNIRSGPGAGNPVSGSFASSATNIMRSGYSSTADGDLWVQVANPGGGSGWINSTFLTEYVDSATFCADGRVNTLLTNLGNALKTSNGEVLASLVSPAHGMTVYQWRHGIAHAFKQSDARWVFDSTFEHNWGAAPASGLDTIGAFHVVVLPNLLDVFNASYSLTCNSLGTAPQYGNNPWPVEYTNVNFYTVYKPGTPGVDLDWRYWLVGVEYVQGQPTIFALVHFAWEP
jgi:hypothetical protein